MSVDAAALATYCGDTANPDLDAWQVILDYAIDETNNAFSNAFKEVPESAYDEVTKRVGMAVSRKAASTGSGSFAAPDGGSIGIQSAANDPLRTSQQIVSRYVLSV